VGATLLRWAIAARSLTLDVYSHALPSTVQTEAAPVAAALD
jgi:hypothetical protein